MSEGQENAAGKDAQNAAPNDAQKRSLWQRFLDSRFRSELGAMYLESLKDVNDKLQQTFFNQQAGPGEMGTPLVPTPQEVTESRGVHGDYQQKLDQAAQRETKPPQREPER
jgi:hypothetical protein